jgi:hypothetical protein
VPRRRRCRYCATLVPWTQSRCRAHLPPRKRLEQWLEELWALDDAPQTPLALVAGDVLRVKRLRAPLLVCDV